MRRSCLHLLLSIWWMLSIAGCGGNVPGTQTQFIVFDSNRALDGSNDIGFRNIWMMRSDGFNPVPLAPLTHAGSRSATWSPDGSKLAYLSNRALDGSDNPQVPFFPDNIWIMNADGSDAKPLTKLTVHGCGEPVWSPDGTKLAFTSIRALDGSDGGGVEADNIWVMNADGSNQGPLTRLNNGLGTQEITWSPDGRKLAFRSERAVDGSDGSTPFRNWNVWVMNADGTSALPLTRFVSPGVDSLSPAWSPDGSKLAFASAHPLDGSDIFGTSNIWLISADGSGLRPLTKLNHANSFMPKWSPDGSKLAFLSCRVLDGGDACITIPLPPPVFGTIIPNIWVMNADGSSPAPLTRLTKAIALTSLSKFLWALDGSRIAFNSLQSLDGSDTEGLVQNIWAVNSDGSVVTPLTRLVFSDVFHVPDNFIDGWRP